jgi:DNA-binding beta-propeller fold protein YncE
MRQPQPRPRIQPRQLSPGSVIVRGVRHGRVALSLAGAVSLLAGPLLAFAPAASAASSTFAVTEVPVNYTAGSVAADPATNTVYATVYTLGPVTVVDGTTVAVINGTTNTLTARLILPSDPVLVAVDSASDTVYAIDSSSAGSAVVVINGATNSITTTISLPAGFSPTSAAVNSVTHLVYVAGEDGTVVVIDGTTDTIAATISLADPVLDPTPSATGLAVDTATNTIYVADSGGSQVATIDGATSAVTSRIDLPAGSDPTGMTVDPAAGLVYVAEQNFGAIAVIDTTTDSVATLTSGLTEPQGLALDTGTGTLYATSVTGSVDDLGTTYVIDTASGVIAAEIPRGGDSAAITPASGGSVYVAGASIVGLLDTDVTVITPSTTNTMSPVIVGSSGFTFIAGEAGQVQVAASATPAATFTGTNGPSWLSLSSSGLLSGTPPADVGGAFGMQVTVSNGVAPPFVGGVTVVVLEAPTTFTSADQVTFGAGVAGSFTMTATGYPAPTFAETGTLPAGVALSEAGVLSGTPAAGTAGSYPITVTASNPEGSVTQQFTLTVEQPYAVQASQQSGFCLDNTGGSGADGNPVQVWSCSGNANQGWLYVPSVNGVAGDYQLENSNGSCLDDPADSAVSGTRVQLWSCLGDASQTWTQVSVGSYTEYQNANGLCLDNTGDNLADGNRVQVWACTGDLAQQWYGPSAQASAIPPVSEVQASRASGFCLDNTGGLAADGNPIQIWSCLGNPSQGWKYVPSANGVAGDYQLQNSDNLCLDDPGDSAVNGTRVQLWSCLGDASQTWTQVSVGSYVEYVNANGLCLDNTGNALTDGNHVQVWACTGDPAQQWYGPSADSNTASA